jgi:hypothetical protein
VRGNPELVCFDGLECERVTIRKKMFNCSKENPQVTVVYSSHKTRLEVGNLRLAEQPNKIISDAYPNTSFLLCLPWPELSH